MAYTERYVTSGAGGGGIGTSGDPWTLAESLTNAVAADRVNVQSDSGYSLGADTVSNAGTVVSYIAFRGYNSSIGDLEGQGRNTDGSLDTTNYPAITLTGQLTPNQRVVFQNLAFTGAINSPLVGSGSIDYFDIVSCDFLNTNNSASASCLQGDNSITVINCDFECSGASHDTVVNSDTDALVYGCRIKGTSSSEILLGVQRLQCHGSTFFGDGIGINIENYGSRHSITGCTFYNLATAIQLPNLLIGNQASPIILDCHATDCSKFIDSLYSGTANTALIEVCNRTRLNTMPRTGVGDGVNSGEVTTDTGGAATDYVDADSGDFTLISTAAGYGASKITKRKDIGAVQHVDPAGGGGGGGASAAIIG